MTINRLQPKLFLTLFIFSALFFVSPPLADARQYLVAQDGSGDFTTIQQAANVATAGDLVTVKAGNYPERVTVFNNGSVNNLVTFQAQTPHSVTTHGFTVYANYIKIDGFNVNGSYSKTCTWSAGDYGIAVYGDYCVVSNNRISQSGLAGIRTYGETVSNLIHQNTVFQNGNSGLEIAGHNHTISRNDISDTRCSPCNRGEANGVYVFGTGHTFSKNYLHDVGFINNPGYNPHIDAFQTFPYNDPNNPEGYAAVNNTTFDSNHIWFKEPAKTSADTVYGWMMEGNTDNLTLTNNLIEVWGGMNFYNATPDYLKIYHNIFRSNLSFPASNWPKGIQLRVNGPVILRNNIFVDYSFKHLQFASMNAITGGYNLFWNSNGTVPSLEGYTLQSSDLTVNPVFVGYQPDLNLSSNLHLQPNSPAVNHGTSIVGVDHDFDGIARPQDSINDLGAFEVVLSPTPSPTSANSPAPTAPTSSEIIIDNTDPRFSFVSSQDSWQEYVEVGGQHYGSSHRYNRLLSTGADLATWAFTLPYPGNYEVYAYWLDGSWRPTDVPYTIHHSLGTDTVSVNQQINGGRWNLLGTYSFMTEGSVVLSDAATNGQDVVADAIRLVYSGTTPPSTLSGDLNNDGQVNSLDMDIILDNWGPTSNSSYDLNLDGQINTLDAGIIILNWNN